MNLKDILKARGLDDANIEQLLTNPAYSSILEGFVKEAEDGKTAYLKAQEVEANVKNYYNTDILPYVQKADQRVAEAEGKLAATTAHLKALKDAGYEIPDSYFSAPDPAKNAQTSNTSAQPVFDESKINSQLENYGKSYLSLMSMSERARDLLGHGLDVEAEYEDFGKNKRPNENLRSYIDRKYDLAGKEQAKQAAARQKELDDYAENKLKEEKAKWAQQYGENPETRLPASSKFDRIRENTDSGRRDSWKTDLGRRESAKARLDKYANAGFLN